MRPRERNRERGKGIKRNSRGRTDRERHLDSEKEIQADRLREGN